jgi:hypothetical protein
MTQDCSQSVTAANTPFTYLTVCRQHVDANQLDGVHGMPSAYDLLLLPTANEHDVKGPILAAAYLWDVWRRLRRCEQSVQRVCVLPCGRRDANVSILYIHP